MIFSVINIFFNNVAYFYFKLMTDLYITTLDLRHSSPLWDFAAKMNYISGKQ